MLNVDLFLSRQQYLSGRTRWEQFLKRKNKGPFQPSLVKIKPVVSEEIFKVNISIFSVTAAIFEDGQPNQTQF